MRPLTPEGRRTINHLAQRYGFSSEAVMTMLQSVIEGHGTMAQFNHPEFGGGTMDARRDDHAVGYV